LLLILWILNFPFINLIHPWQLALFMALVQVHLLLNLLVKDSFFYEKIFIITLRKIRDFSWDRHNSRYHIHQMVVKEFLVEELNIREVNFASNFSFKRDHIHRLVSKVLKDNLVKNVKIHKHVLQYIIVFVSSFGNQDLLKMILRKLL